MADFGLMLLVLCKCCGLTLSTKAGCKTDKKAQRAALCLPCMTLRAQLVHSGHPWPRPGRP